MEPEFIIKIVLGIVGAGLIAGGIAGIVKSKDTGGKIWSVVAIAIGVVMWLVILFTTILSSTTS
jgi:hypothetical protein